MVLLSNKGIYAIDGKTKKIIWNFKCGQSTIPLIYRNTIYIKAFKEGKDEECLFAIDKKTATPIWETLINKSGYNSLPTSPVIVNKNICIDTRQNGIMGIDIKTGKILWNFKIFHTIYNSMVADNNTIYFTSIENYGDNVHLFALDSKTGSIK